jgi:hypothetical protein
MKKKVLLSVQHRALLEDVRSRACQIEESITEVLTSSDMGTIVELIDDAFDDAQQIHKYLERTLDELVQA